MKKHFLQWIIAFFVAFFLLNILIIPFYYDPGWIKRSGGANRGFYEPGKYFIQSSEGYGIAHVDENGYLNASSELGENYCLILGNSQSNMQFVMQDKRWISILNYMLGGNDSKIMAYNCSVGGLNFCDIVSGLQAALTEFDNAQTLIIQVTELELTSAELEKCLEQRDSSEKWFAVNKMQHLSAGEKIKNVIKDFFPLVIYSQERIISKIDFSFDGMFGIYKDKTEVENVKFDEECYKNNMQKALDFICDSFEGDIVVLQISGTDIVGDHLEYSVSKKEAIFRELCVNYDIDYIDMRETFIGEFENVKKLPNGFNNTYPGYGHLNEYGNELVAQRVFEAIRGN